MSFLKSLNIAGSALTAERFRIDTIAQNLANLNTTRTSEGGPYRRKQVVFEEQKLSFANVLSNNVRKKDGQDGGVRVTSVVESDADFIPVYDPTHPDANAEGYVMYPNVNRTEEQIDLMAATRAYEANLVSLNIIKAMAMKAMDIGK